MMKISVFYTLLFRLRYVRPEEMKNSDLRICNTIKTWLQYVFSTFLTVIYLVWDCYIFSFIEIFVWNLEYFLFIYIKTISVNIYHIRISDILNQRQIVFNVQYDYVLWIINVDANERDLNYTGQCEESDHIWRYSKVTMKYLWFYKNFR